MAFFRDWNAIMVICPMSLGEFFPLFPACLNSKIRPIARLAGKGSSFSLFFLSDSRSTPGTHFLYLLVHPLILSGVFSSVHFLNVWQVRFQTFFPASSRHYVLEQTLQNWHLPCTAQNIPHKICGRLLGVSCAIYCALLTKTKIMQRDARFLVKKAGSAVVLIIAEL